MTLNFIANEETLKRIPPEVLEHLRYLRRRIQEREATDPQRRIEELEATIRQLQVEDIIFRSKTLSTFHPAPEGLYEIVSSRHAFA
jgi:hypothetical protein